MAPHFLTVLCHKRLFPCLLTISFLDPSLASPKTNTHILLFRSIPTLSYVKSQVFLAILLVSDLFTPSSSSLSVLPALLLFFLRRDWLMISITIEVDHLTSFLYCQSKYRQMAFLGTLLASLATLQLCQIRNWAS